VAASLASFRPSVTWPSAAATSARRGMHDDGSRALEVIGVLARSARAPWRGGKELGSWELGREGPRHGSSSSPVRLASASSSRGDPELCAFDRFSAWHALAFSWQRAHRVTSEPPSPSGLLQKPRWS
jgi:hypothetical protein